MYIFPKERVTEIGSWLSVDLRFTQLEGKFKIITVQP